MYVRGGGCGGAARSFGRTRQRYGISGRTARGVRRGAAAKYYFHARDLHSTGGLTTAVDGTTEDDYARVPSAGFAGIRGAAAEGLHRY